MMAPSTLKEIRKELGESITKFSLRLGISRNTLSCYETGRNAIPRHIALAVRAIRAGLEE